MTLFSRLEIAVESRPSVTTTAMVMTPRTTAYSAIVWPDSSVFLRSERADTWAPIVGGLGAAEDGHACPNDPSVLHPGLSPQRVDGRLTEPLIEVDRSRDQREMGECLGKVAEQLARRPDLLGVEAQVVRVGEHLLERQPGLVEPADTRQRLDVPERGDRERPFVALEPVRRCRGVVAVDETVRDELLADRIERREPPRVLRGDEARERHEQHRRVEDVGLVVLHERPPLLVPAPGHDLGGDLVARLEPCDEVGGEPALPGDADGALDRDPRHQPRVREVLTPAARLPDALVG